jgi:hypothetical protein
VDISRIFYGGYHFYRSNLYTMMYIQRHHKIIWRGLYAIYKLLYQDLMEFM